MEWKYEIIEPFVVTDNEIFDNPPTNFESVTDYDGKCTSRLNELGQQLEFKPKYICRFKFFLCKKFFRRFTWSKVYSHYFHKNISIIIGHNL